MDGIFSKFVTCCNSIQTHKGTIGWAFGNFNLLVAASVAIYVSAYLCRQTTLVSSSTRYAGDYIILCVIFLGNLVRILFSIYKPVKIPPTSDLARSTGDAGDNIVARTSDGSEKSTNIVSDAAIRSGVQTGLSWRARLYSTFSGLVGWTDTFELDLSELGKPIGPVTEQGSWEVCLGQPMKQPEKATCALVACIVGVEAMNRFVYGEGTGAAAGPCELLQMCKDKGIWDKRTGAFVSDVLDLIQEQGGVPLANPPSDALTVLPLSGWHEYTDAQFTQERVAKLLDNGPCIGTLWVCPWYYLFDARRNDAWVYRGCGRSQESRARSMVLYGTNVSSHAVVCFGYRCCGGQMHLLVLDNHNTKGPQRWVDLREIDALYTLTVK